MASCRLSVVVCTHNRPSDLRRCLLAVAALEDPVEVIVVDSASRPPCRELVESFAETIPNLRYVREDEPGLSSARNRAVSEAAGGIVAFLDDDTAPRPDWARLMLEAFALEPTVGCVGGACVASFAEGAHRPHWLSDRLLQFAGITRFGSASREARSSAEWPFGANIAFRVAALTGEQPFSPKLGRNGTRLLSGEESDLVERMRDAGWKIWLAPDAVVEHTVHADRCTSGYYWRRLWWAGVSRARSTEAAAMLALRLLVALPVRLCLYVLTRDRVYLYRTAETAGFIVERVRRTIARAA